MTVLAAIPSPTQGVWELGPLPLRAYALCIVAGIVAAVLTHRAALGGPRRSARRRARHRRLGGAVRDHRRPDLPRDLQPPRRTSARAATRCGPSPSGRAASASGAPSPSAGSAPGSPAAAAASRCRPSPTPLAPGLLVAQAIGRLGNWFNNELYGGPTDLPWALQIYEWERRPGGRSAPTASRSSLGTFHPTFLYELLWNLAAAALVIWADRRFRLGHGRAFALYVASYCAGRLWIELLRTDPAETFFGVRLNVFTSIVVGLLAVAYFVWQRGRPREVIDRGGAASRGRRRRGAAPARAEERRPDGRR